MKGCDAMVDAGQRTFLAGASLAAAGAAAATITITGAKAGPDPARVDYPSNRLANVHDLKQAEKGKRPFLIKQWSMAKRLSRPGQ